jgi:hypothetical protein
MPFVLMALPRQIRKEDIESACKDAWTSMNGIHGVSGLKASEVGGAICEGNPSAPLVSFVYVDRGKKFDEHLCNVLADKFEVLVGKQMFVETVPTDANMWFIDPEWAVPKCTRQHVGDVTMPIIPKETSHISAELMYDYWFRAELKGGEKQFIEQHFEDCEICRKRLAVFEERFRDHVDPSASME